MILLDPKLWDDRNDAELILANKEKKGIGNLLAICMGHGDETVHHWKTFSNGTSGCMIEFDPEKFSTSLMQCPASGMEK